MNVTSENLINPNAVDLSVLVGLVGCGITKSRTPAMHMREGQRLGIPYIYKFLDMDLSDIGDLASVIDRAQFFGFAGLNITFPFKQQVLALLDEVSADAERIGSVNTVVFKNGKRIGYNTDFFGFAENVGIGLGDISGKVVLQIGAGGAGLSVAWALAHCKIEKLLIRDTDGEKAKSLADNLASQIKTEIVSEQMIKTAAQEADGIVNATPVGMASLPGLPISGQYIESRHFVADIIYFPIETELLKAARKIGCRTLSGEGMAVFQAMKAFELFSGQKPDSVEMKRTFKSFDQVSVVGSTE
ncbi:MAG: shikimate dehydrogenase [Rhizobiaceae bacterium]|nr:shikimate dehydrogenase [Rhizobiaceae bacterium]